MARDFIKIDPVNSSPQAQLLRSYVANLRNAYDQGTRILAIMGHLNDGVDFSDIETVFGLPVGKGQVVFNLINGSVGSMNGSFQVSDAKNITEEVG